MITIKFNRDFSLTTNHSASSYGRPVLIDRDGDSFGPADMVDSGPFGMTPAADETADYRQFSDPDEADLMARWLELCGKVRPLTESEQYFISHNRHGA